MGIDGRDIGTMGCFMMYWLAYQRGEEWRNVGDDGMQYDGWVWKVERS
jgi:hypothetical protein